jgi:hypothetical protein
VVVGQTYGRWTVLKLAAPLKRAQSDTGMQSRAVTRCVCGHEQVSWLKDLELGRSAGCRSLKCRARYEALGELDGAIDRLLAGNTSMRQMAARLKARLRHWLPEARQQDVKLARERLDEQLRGDGISELGAEFSEAEGRRKSG